MSDFDDYLREREAWFCRTHWVWAAGLAVFAFAGAGLALFGGRLALAHADAPYLKVQPVSKLARRRMAGFAVAICSLGLAAAAAAISAAICEIIHKPKPAAWGLLAALAYMLGASAGLAVRLFTYRETAANDQATESRRVCGLNLPAWLARMDRARPAWISSWSIGLAGRRLPLSFGRVLAFLVIILAAVMAGASSLADHHAAQAAAGAVLTGFAAFMLVVRCQNLDSPVLRTAPIGFLQAWFGMLRLPLLLSGFFFVIPAAAAIAAEPSAWAMNVSGGAGLLVLDGAYAIFAGFFLMSPLLAAISFFAVVFYASYKWVTYHEVVYACFAGLLVLMFYRIRRSFYDGR